MPTSRLVIRALCCTLAASATTPSSPMELWLKLSASNGQLALSALAKEQAAALPNRFSMRLSLRNGLVRVPRQSVSAQPCASADPPVSPMRFLPRKSSQTPAAASGATKLAATSSSIALFCNCNVWSMPGRSKPSSRSAFAISVTISVRPSAH